MIITFNLEKIGKNISPKCNVIIMFCLFFHMMQFRTKLYFFKIPKIDCIRKIRINMDKLQDIKRAFCMNI